MGRYQIITVNPDEISRQYPMSIMAVDEYMDEPENRKRMTPKPATRSDCDITDDEWREMICIIARYAGPSPSGSGSALADFLRESATHLEQACFRLQIDRAIKFLNDIRAFMAAIFHQQKPCCCQCLFLNE